MKRLAAVLAAATAVAGAGCHSGTRQPATGSAILYWDFVRTAPAQTSGSIVYDQGLTGTGNGTCPESAVDTVTIDAPGVAQIPVSCVYGGVQGITVSNLLVGTNVVRVRGWRGSVAVYDGQFSIAVQPGGAAAQNFLDVPAVSARMDVYADIGFGAGPTLYADCAAATPAGSASPPNLFVDIREVLSTHRLIEQPPGAACAGALPAPVFSNLLDLDDYEVRVQATRAEDGAVVADSCWVSLAHFGAQPGNGFAPIALTAPIPTCSP